MEAYLPEVRKIEKQFLGLELQHVPRGTNREADEMAKKVSRRLPQKPGVSEERLFKPSAAPPAAESAPPQEGLPPPPASGAPACGPTVGARLLLVLEPQEGCSTEEFRAYLVQGTLPKKEEGAERVARKQGCELLADIHGGDCGHHSLSHTLVGKAFRSGFYWSTALNDATKLVRLNTPKDKVAFLKALGMDPAAMIAAQGLLIACSTYGSSETVLLKENGIVMSVLLLLYFIIGKKSR
nr:uncharacterized protein LOC109744499 [Aegilops tauschii subsp. strangulata]